MAHEIHPAFHRRGPGRVERAENRRQVEIRQRDITGKAVRLRSRRAVSQAAAEPHRAVRAKPRPAVGQLQRGRIQPQQPADRGDLELLGTEDLLQCDRALAGHPAPEWRRGRQRRLVTWNAAGARRRVQRSDKRQGKGLHILHHQQIACEARVQTQATGSGGERAGEGQVGFASRQFENQGRVERDLVIRRQIRPQFGRQTGQRAQCG